MRHVVILGAGTAGTMVANKLRAASSPADLQITIVDQDDHHHYQPGYLFLPFGQLAPGQIVRARHSFIPDGVDLVLCGHKHVPNVWRLEDMLIVNAGTACTHRLRGHVKPCYNIIEIIDHRRVRVLLKEPYLDPEVVADFHDVNRRYCRWRPGAGPDESGIEPSEEEPM